jgi:hypothetical protein
VQPTFADRSQSLARIHRFRKRRKFTMKVPMASRLESWIRMQVSDVPGSCQDNFCEALEHRIERQSRKARYPLPPMPGPQLEQRPSQIRIPLAAEAGNLGGMMGNTFKSGGQNNRRTACTIWYTFNSTTVRIRFTCVGRKRLPVRRSDR